MCVKSLRPISTRHSVLYVPDAYFLRTTHLVYIPLVVPTRFLPSHLASLLSTPAFELHVPYALYTNEYQAISTIPDEQRTSIISLSFRSAPLLLASPSSYVILKAHPFIGIWPYMACYKLSRFNCLLLQRTVFSAYPYSIKGVWQALIYWNTNVISYIYFYMI